MVWRPLRILRGATGLRSRPTAPTAPDHRSRRLDALRPGLARSPGWLVTRSHAMVAGVSQTSSIPSNSASDLLAQRLHVLVVEDDELSLDIITRWLRRRGCADVRGVADGPAGLAACFQRLPDLLLLDHRLPGFSGLAIAEHLRMNFAREQRPWTVLFTATCNASIMRLMGSGNFDDLLRKPCVGEDYIGMLTRTRAGLHERRSAADIAEARVTLHPRLAL